MQGRTRIKAFGATQIAKSGWCRGGVKCRREPFKWTVARGLEMNTASKR